MLKKLVFPLTFILLSALVSAEIGLVSPVEYKASHQETVALGSLQAGETLELIVSRSTGPESVPWKQAIVEPKFIPVGWRAEDYGLVGKIFLVKIFVPLTALPGEYSFRVKLLSGSEDYSNEVFDALIQVERGLVKANIANLKRLTAQDQPVSFKLSLLNDSIAQHSVSVESTLGLNWFKPVQLSLKPRSTLDYTLTVNPVVASRAPFSFSVRSLVSSQPVNRFDAVLEVRPTLQGKLEAASYGFPFYTYSLAPFYFLNALLAPFLP